jgi:hypothetical protein
VFSHTYPKKKINTTCNHQHLFTYVVYYISQIADVARGRRAS